LEDEWAALKNHAKREESPSKQKKIIVEKEGIFDRGGGSSERKALSGTWKPDEAMLADILCSAYR